MECALFTCPAPWRMLLPSGVRTISAAMELSQVRWDVLALTEDGCAQWADVPVSCRILLLPGDSGMPFPAGVAADYIITYGLSSQNSLTLSSFEEPVLCIQRMLPCPSGAWLETQELPLLPLPVPASTCLPLLGLQLLLEVPPFS